MYARPETRDRDFDRLIRGSYGLPVTPGPSRVGPSVTMSTDTGAEVIAQPGVSPGPPDFVEYVVDREPQPPAAPAAPVATLPVSTPVPAPAPLVPPTAGALVPTPAPATPVAPPVDPPTAITPAQPMPAPAPAPADPMPVVPTFQPVPPAPVVPAALAASPLTSADLAADMQAILSGRRPDDVPPVDPGRPLPDAAPEQSIFDKIAASMEYANSFDLGTVDLQRRFDTLARVDASRRVAPRATAMTEDDAGAGAPVDAAPAPAETRDDDAFWAAAPAGALGSVTLVEGCSTGARLVVPDRSVPMYDTGEHVLAGGDLYTDQLIVNGVPFSYGQLMAMGDLYGTVADLRAAPAGELTRLKGLIEQDTRHYQGTGAGVPNDTWQAATNGRYLTLADDNYSHFSPPSALGMTDPITKPENRSTWQRCHDQAIAEMQALVAATPNADVAPYGPLTANAFGDHFLTDAFASGHLVNKELVLNRLQAAIYQPGTWTLSPAGSSFIGRLAAQCWADPAVRSLFSPLEEVQTRWTHHWNIDTENAFRSLLVAIAQQAPTKVLNLALKALHDHLNTVGVPVTNEAGDGPWLLKGDLHLADSQSLPIMRKAVDASVANILDPAILTSQAGAVDNSALYAKVWRFVPRPTAAGLAQARAAMADFTNLGSATLLTQAARVVVDQSPLIAKELRLKHLLQDEDSGREADFWRQQNQEQSR